MYCNTLQYTAAHYNTLQHTATHCNTQQHTATRCNTLQHTATHCNTLQHTTTQSLEHFHDTSALDARISDVYDFLDCDQSGALSKVCNNPHARAPYLHQRTPYLYKRALSLCNNSRARAPYLHQRAPYLHQRAPHLNKEEDWFDCDQSMGLQLVWSIQLLVSFAEYRLLCRALLQKKPVILSILLTEATPYVKMSWQDILRYRDKC